MQKHKINCQQCGEEFESARSDAMYCSNSCKTRASQIRTKGNPVIKMKFEQHEFENLCEIAKEFDLSVEELVKYRSMLTAGDLNRSNDLYEELESEIKKLKAELSLHTKSQSAGIFLDVNESEKNDLLNAIKNIKLLSNIKGNLSYKIAAAVHGCYQYEKLFNKNVKAKCQPNS